MKTTDPVLAARSRLGTLVRFGGTPSEVHDARQQLAASKVERAVRELVAAFPDLTDERRERLAAILRGGAA